MKKKFILILILLFISACSNNTESDKQIKIAVTIPPLGEFVDEIGGDDVDTTILVPPGANPHTYEPSPSQLTLLSEADFLVIVGTPIEFELVWLDKLVSVNKDIIVINSSDGINLIENEEDHSRHEEDHSGHEEDHSELDPHVWTSPANAKTMVKNIYESLGNEDFLDNFNEYNERLDDLDLKFKNIIKEKQQKKFLVFHPAWGYLSQEYDLTQISLEHEGKEITAKNIRDVIDTAKQENINVIFASPQFSTESAQVIAREINGQVLLIDPMDRNYTDNLNNIADTFDKVLQ
ncbi:zinc ABC transporter substrate-binding protein [Candidatus Woesearchaeota archaeon]|nr:zinc ABC transporter substrate-binding protein [Candidatus Woesearchaeota archaeon]